MAKAMIIYFALLATYTLGLVETDGFAKLAIDKGATTGVIVKQDANKIFVERILDGSTAAVDGSLSVGDRLLKVDGHDAVALGAEKVNTILRAPYGKVVAVEAVKAGGKVIKLKLVSGFVRNDPQVIDDIEKDILGK